MKRSIFSNKSFFSYAFLKLHKLFISKIIIEINHLFNFIIYHLYLILIDNQILIIDK